MIALQSALPEVVPIFPLAQAILLPRAQLPLNVFEPRYLDMTDDALRSHRVIGMIQPKSGGPNPPVHRIGTLGRMVSWSLNDDGKMKIVLEGLIRFSITEEIPVSTAYRQVRADYSAFSGDLDEDPGTSIVFDRRALFEGLTTLLAQHQLKADWQPFAEAPVEMLINALTMLCPFDVLEKQALLEAETLTKRTHVLVALVERAVATASGTRMQ